MNQNSSPSLSFSDRLRAGLKLTQESFTFLSDNRACLIFPVMTFVLLGLLFSAFLSVIMARYGINPFDAATFAMLKKGSPERAHIYFAGFGFLFLFIALGSIIGAFLNVALVHYVINLMDKKPACIGASVARSFERLGTIILWALINMSVGSMLNSMKQQRQGVLSLAQNFVGSALGMAWSVLTYFVVPVLATQELGIIATIEESGRIMRQTFGEAIAATFSFGVITTMGTLLIAFPVAGLFSLLFHAGIGIVAGITALLCLGIVVQTAKMIFKVAVYQYARQRPVLEFDKELLAQAFVAQPKNMAGL